MWIIATTCLKNYLPDTPKGAGRTTVDVSSTLVPRIFLSEASARAALTHWFNGPYIAILEYEDWTYKINTDPARKQVWGKLLAPREIRIESAYV